MKLLFIVIALFAAFAYVENAEGMYVLDLVKFPMNSLLLEAGQFKIFTNISWGRGRGL